MRTKSGVCCSGHRRRLLAAAGAVGPVYRFGKVRGIVGPAYLVEGRRRKRRVSRVGAREGTATVHVLQV